MESEEGDGSCEHSDTNPLHIKFDDDIVKWELLEGGVTVDQCVKDGFSSSCKCSITWPANVEIAEFKDVGDCWGVMFPSDFFFGEQSVLKWTNQSLPHDIPPFTPHEFLQCIGVLYGLCLAGQSSAKNLWQAKDTGFCPPFRLQERFGLSRDRFLFCI